MMENKNQDKIEILRNKVREELNKEITRDYVLLDIPSHRNIGDTLIWQGELEYLKELSVKCLYSSNRYAHKNNSIGEDEIILLHGGGNFGDVWSASQVFRNDIIKAFPTNKIIVLPQTIHYSNHQKLKEDAELYNKHPDLTICARDKISFEIAKENFVNCKILLLPDMAFFNDFSKYYVADKSERTLFMKRMDKEMGNEEIFDKYVNLNLNANKKIEIKDWPGFGPKGSLEDKLQNYLQRIDTKGSLFLKNSLFSFLVDDTVGLRRKNYKDYRIKVGIDFMNQYGEVYSTRLHGFILATLLNKKVFIFDNSYGKNKNFYETWLKSFDQVEFLRE